MRNITSFRVLESLLDVLKSLFVPYFSYVFDSALEVLESMSSGPDDLWRRVMGCLYKVFLYDTNGFMNEERFKKIVKPLVSQLDMLERYEDCMV
jgi:hypothetical protein